MLFKSKYIFFLKQFGVKKKMRRTSKTIIGVFVVLTLFSLINARDLVAANGPPVDIPGDTVQTKVQAHNRTTYTFRNRTRLTFNCSANAEVNIVCDALNIGQKDFELEVISENDLQMNMTCTEEQNQLGLMKGHTYRLRNRNRYRYEEGFCISIQCNQSSQIQARLKILATNQNRGGTWAYYAEDTEEWVSVQTTEQNGYLVCETNSFSIWTVLIPESDDTIMGFGSITAIVDVVAVIAIVSVVLLKRRK